MFIPFESLPDHSRIWIYQSNRKFSASEKDIIAQELLLFTEQWQVHGQPMKTSFKMYFDQFIILAADEGFNAASGCSIDGSVRILKTLGTQFNIDFFDRDKVAFKKDENNILLFPLSALKEKFSQGVWEKDTLTFNNLIATKGDIEKGWIATAGSTWLKRYVAHEAMNL